MPTPCVTSQYYLENTAKWQRKSTVIPIPQSHATGSDNACFCSTSNRPPEKSVVVVSITEHYNKHQSRRKENSFTCNRSTFLRFLCLYKTELHCLDGEWLIRPCLFIDHLGEAIVICIPEQRGFRRSITFPWSVSSCDVCNVTIQGPISICWRHLYKEIVIIIMIEHGRRTTIIIMCQLR